MTFVLDDFLREAGDFSTPPKERTLFSLGGRGHYENPVSDLLAFFMNPQAEHGLKTLFLAGFFDCLPVDVRSMRFDGVTVGREIQTGEGKRIDLLVQSAGWVLLIENKIHHAVLNPFRLYEAFARELPGERNLHFAVLSPGEAKAPPGWYGVSYKRYCQALRSRFAAAVVDASFSKWQIFAREFILHLENELYQTAMTSEQAAFVEKHIVQIAQVQNLAKQYPEFLCAELQQALSTSAGCDFTTKDEGWAIRCNSERWGLTNLAFRPAMKEKSRRFHLTVYFHGLTPAQRADAGRVLSDMHHWEEEKGTWQAWCTVAGFETRQNAIIELCRLADVVTRLLPPPASFSPPVPVVTLGDSPAPGA